MKFIYSSVLALFIFFSCTSRAVQPTRQSRHTIDTLFQQKVILLKPEMDSVCDGLFKEIYTAAIDSIMEARKMEMNILVE